MTARPFRLALVAGSSLAVTALGGGAAFAAVGASSGSPAAVAPAAVAPAAVSQAASASTASTTAIAAEAPDTADTPGAPEPTAPETDGPGGHADRAGANVDHQFDGVE
jgi:hypothetical protein